MPLLEIVPSKKVQQPFHLKTTANLVNQYAAFHPRCRRRCGEPALEYVFTKDKDFQKFIGSPNDASTTSIAHQEEWR